MRLDSETMASKAEIAIKNRCTGAKGEGRSGVNWEVGTDIYTLLHIS